MLDLKSRPPAAWLLRSASGTLIYFYTMFGDGSLSLREFAMREPLPLATIQDALLEFLRGRDDLVLFGAHAVNAYVEEPRMTQDVDVLSTRAEGGGGW